MIHKSYSFARAMGCCSCFGFLRKPKRRPVPISSGGRNYLDHNNNHLSQELLLDSEIDDDGGGDDGSFNGDITGTSYCDYAEFPNRAKRSEENLRLRELNGMVCRQSPVKETHLLVRSEDEDGNKMINEYVRQYKIGAGSYGKVAFHKSHLLKLRVAPSETAMNDVLRELAELHHCTYQTLDRILVVMIMKMLDHPNIVNLIEVIDDPNTDHFYMVLEYVDGKWVWEGSGPPGGIGEDTARKYLRDIVSGLMYLHAHNIVHGDIKPDNLLVTRSGTVKIGDFSVSQDDNDELRRSPGTPVFTAPECCLGLTYHGKAADTWAVGIVNNPLVLPGEMNSQLKDLLEGLLCKDPEQRMTLDAVANHTWVIGDDGSIPQYLCWCKRSSMQREASDGNNNGIHNLNGICNHTESNGSNFDANMTLTGKIV
uniref:Protein kinase domain-containing protein n=1 Tax=Salix viminalis TaxID=40686 RepID=A0A6N2L5F6_SALVM